MHRRLAKSYKSLMKKPSNIAVLEDHPLTRTGIRLALAPLYHIGIEASTVSELFARLQTVSVELLILDIMLPDCSGIEVASRVKHEYPDIKVLVYTVDTAEDTVRRLLEIGVDGLLSKKSSEKTVLQAVTTVIDGGNFYLEDEEQLERDILVSQAPNTSNALTERENDVLLGFCKGMTSFEIADALCISQRTVENHKLHIFRKCGINNTVEMLLYAIRNGIVVL